MSRRSKLDPKITYAKSSDIKGRAYLEYRRDMKRKAIAELEAIEWIESVLQKEYSGSQVRVEKSGGDQFLWFLRGGGVSRKPDYIATIDEKTLEIEFQYADKSNVDFYDFNLSKISKQDKTAGKRIPKDHVIILYIDKTRSRYAILTTAWIAQNGIIGQVPAWRTEAYRVPAEKFRENLKQDESLSELIQRIDDKNILLEFQHGAYERARRDLQQKVENAVLSDLDFRLIPTTLEGFWEACVILEAMERCPESLDAWLQKALDFANEASTLEGLFRASFCLDYLYFCKPVPGSGVGLEQANDWLSRLGEVFRTIIERVNKFYSGHGQFQSESQRSACEETRYALFAVGVVEDMIQDAWHYYSETIAGIIQNFPNPIKRIYQSVSDHAAIASFVRECTNLRD
jgi:hypothetical protein